MFRSAGKKVFGPRLGQVLRASGSRSAALYVSLLVAGGVGLTYSVANQNEIRLESAVAPKGKLISMDEVRQHREKDDCWVVIDGTVWDVTKVLKMHPAGPAVILKIAGEDVTKKFKAIHPSDTIEMQFPGLAKKIGELDPATAAREAPAEDKDIERIAKAREELPPVESIIGLKRMEAAAKTVLGNRARKYYEHGADDENAMFAAFEAFQNCRFRPRVFVDVSEINPTATILNHESPLPIYIAPAAYAKLGHELGELNITRGAAKTGILQGISSNASYSLAEILQEKKTLEDSGENKVGMAFQIYVNVNHDKTKKIIQQAVDGGCSSFFVTVDSPALGNREEDAIAQGLVGDMSAKPRNHKNDDIFGYYENSLTWKDLKWIKDACKGKPLYVKGIVTYEDVELAKKYGADGVVLSNHGGRQLDYAKPPFDALREINERNPSLTKELEIYVDGGIRRGTDVLKALCLGARGVGLGRPFLYAQTAYGELGVIRAVRIMEDEIIRDMRLLGVTSVDQLKPEHLECLDTKWKVPRPIPK